MRVSSNTEMQAKFSAAVRKLVVPNDALINFLKEAFGSARKSNI